MSLFYVGIIIYIEGDIFLRKKKKGKTADSLHEYLSYTAVGIFQEWIDAALHDHDMSTEFDQNAYQRSNSSIEGISTLTSHFIESDYSRWILENASLILFFFLEIREHAS